MKEIAERWLGMAIRGAIAYAAYRLFGWIGFGIWVFVATFELLLQLVERQKTISDTLLSRLPDRCAFCHREIVDEGGVIDKDRIYHDACAEKLDSLEELRKEAGIPSREAINGQPKIKKAASQR